MGQPVLREEAQELSPTIKTASKTDAIAKRFIEG
jgi:hypothetical protein